MILRTYEAQDCEETAELFYETVHKVNIRDYTEAQVNVWASGNMDLREWHRSLEKNYSLVAVEDGKIIGFGDIDETGYLDHLFVHHGYQRRGVAAALCEALEQPISGKIRTLASITAKGFFEKRGYRVIKEQQVQRQGIFLKNYIMEKMKAGESHEK